MHFTISIAFTLFASTFVRSAPAALDAATLLKNGQDAQKLNAQFFTFKATDSCQGQAVACVAGAIANCVSGKWDTSTGACSKSQECFAVPNVRSAGTDLICTSEKSAQSVIGASGATGGITGTDAPGSNSTDTSATPSSSAAIPAATEGADPTGSTSSSASTSTSASASTSPATATSTNTGTTGATKVPDIVTVTVTVTPTSTSTSSSISGSITTLTPDEASSVLSSILGQGQQTASSSSTSTSVASTITSSVTSSAGPLITLSPAPSVSVTDFGTPSTVIRLTAAQISASPSASASTSSTASAAPVVITGTSSGSTDGGY